MLVPLKVKGINASKHKLRDFILIALYISSLNQKSLEVYAYIKCELHLVEGLKANINIGNNIFYTKDFSINFTNTSAHIPNCGIDIAISARHYSEFLKHKVLANAATFIATKFETFVLFQ